MPRVSGVTLYESPREPKTPVSSLRQAKLEICILDSLIGGCLTVAEIATRTGLSAETIRSSLRRMKGISVREQSRKWGLIPCEPAKARRKAPQGAGKGKA